jgi:hypothetical protein
MKNLANCTPTEFLKQTYRIKKDLEKWITEIDLKNIRARKPEIEEIPPNVTDEEKRDIIVRNGKRVKEQGMKNMSDLLDAAMGAHPDETLRILALLCFVEPENVDDHSMSEYIQCLTVLMSDEAVDGFFVSFYRLGQTNILNA